MMSHSPPPETKRLRGFQFTLGSLMVATAWVGLLCVALRTPTEFWAGTIFLLTILALLTSVLVVIFREQAVRAFAVGFLVFSIGYLVCLTLILHTPGAMMQGWTPVQDASLWLFQRLHPPTVVQPGTGGPALQVDLYGRQGFGVICNLAITSFLGVLGGIAAQILYATRRQEVRA